MLIDLAIKNYALIKESFIKFENGLNVLSGETGAGKSIIFEALSVLLGERASKSMIKSGTDHAVIEAHFTVDDFIVSKLKEKGLDGDDGVILIRRDLYADYPSVSRINGYSVTLNDLKEITAHLCDIYGQYEHQMLLNKDNYIPLIDKMMNEKDRQILKESADLYLLLKKHVNKLKQLEIKSDNLDTEKDYIEYQINEINNINPIQGELEDIQLKLKKLQNIEYLNNESLNVVYSLKGGDDLDSVDAITLIARAVDSLEKIIAYDSSLGDINTRLKSAMYEIEDIADIVDDVREKYEYDDEKIDTLLSRQNELQVLMNKYRTDIDGVMTIKAKLEDELNNLENIEYEIKTLKNDIKDTEERYLAMARTISNIRKNIAKNIEVNLTSELKELEMKNVQFQVNFTEKNPSIDGIDDVDFMISTNLGSDLKPLGEVVSGGEMSRLMLALKKILADADYTRTLVFDEIDAGLSGKVANAVGNRLEELAQVKQVLIISHLPQIISKANTHFKIVKADREDETYSIIKKLDYDERVEEIARLISGETVSEATLKNAKLLLDEKRCKDGLSRNNN